MNLFYTLDNHSSDNFLCETLCPLRLCAEKVTYSSGLLRYARNDGNALVTRKNIVTH